MEKFTDSNKSFRAFEFGRFIDFIYENVDGIVDYNMDEEDSDYTFLIDGGDYRIFIHGDYDTDGLIDHIDWEVRSFDGLESIDYQIISAMTDLDKVVDSIVGIMTDLDIVEG